jgi:hypothetical protein
MTKTILQVERCHIKRGGAKDNCALVLETDKGAYQLVVKPKLLPSLITSLRRLKAEQVSQSTPRSIPALDEDGNRCWYVPGEDDNGGEEKEEAPRAEPSFFGSPPKRAPARPKPKRGRERTWWPD